MCGNAVGREVGGWVLCVEDVNVVGGPKQMSYQYIISMKRDISNQKKETGRLSNVRLLKRLLVFFCFCSCRSFFEARVLHVC